MSEFSRLIVTKKGQGLVAKMIAGGGSVQYTKVCSSNARYGLSQLEELDAIEKIQQTSSVSKVFLANDTETKIEVSFSNTDLSDTGYYMRTLGLYAVDPDEGEILYAVSIETSGNCYMPPYDGLTVSGIYIQIAVTIGNAESVSFGMDQAMTQTIREIRILLYEHEKRLALLERMLGIYTYVYPDVDGDGVISAVDTALMLDFISHAATGEYTDDAAGWADFAEVNGLKASVYPDVDGDGVISAVDTALMLDFISHAATGEYTDDAAGWNDYMNARFKVTGSSVQYMGVLNTHFTGTTGLSGIIETQETEES